MKLAVLGAGAWGTALAKVLSENGHKILLWAHRAEHLEQIRRSGRNERYLPGIDLPKDWQFELDVKKAAAEADGIIVAVPSRAIRPLCAQLHEYSRIMVSVVKGLEYETGLTMSGVIQSLAPHASVAVLSGPTFALEVARNIPTAIVAASSNQEVAKQVQHWFHRPAFRVYFSEDILGVELGGALKNVAAIAAGVCDGIGFGDNSKAALIPRAIAEMRRMGLACGASPETFSGLSGLGDLALTCFSKLSRNRELGARLGHGEKLEEISQGRLAEGYPTARSAYRLARQLDVSTPILDEVYAMLYEHKPVKEAVRALIQRDIKAED